MGAFIINIMIFEANVQQKKKTLAHESEKIIIVPLDFPRH